MATAPNIEPREMPRRTRWTWHGLRGRHECTEGGASVETNPYYLVTQQTVAWNSGWRDQDEWLERHRK
jgi:hypothetical protein